jgi:hypothetical protein
MEQKTTIDKLQILLPHWVEHNSHHGEDFWKWAELARQDGHQELAALLDQAISSMKVTDGILEKALALIGGSDSNHHHHHHNNDHNHDHDHAHDHDHQHCHTHGQKHD